MQPMAEDVQLRVTPGHHFAIPPNKAVAIVERDKRHGQNTPVALSVMIQINYTAVILPYQLKNLTRLAKLPCKTLRLNP